MPETTSRSDILPDIPADGFHPPHWMVLTAGGVILAGAISSAVLALVGVLEPRSTIMGASGSAAASVNGAILQAVPLGAYVVNERAPAPSAPHAKTDEETALAAAKVDPAAAMDPAAVISPAAEAPPEKPVEAALKEIPF
jgi:hypothetical protein